MENQDFEKKLNNFCMEVVELNEDKTQLNLVNNKIFQSSIVVDLAICAIRLFAKRT